MKFSTYETKEVFSKFGDLLTEEFKCVVVVEPDQLREAVIDHVDYKGTSEFVRNHMDTFFDNVNWVELADFYSVSEFVIDEL